MQQIQFVREGLNSYMTIKSQTELNPELYRDTVLELAKIPNFMNYEIREVDGEQVLYYKFIYRTMLRQVLGDVSFTPDKIKNMIASIIHALQQAESYLLNQDNIVWRSDCTFIEIETGKLVFTYLPGMNNETDSLQSFLMELIQYVNKEQSDTYLYVMGFYNLVTNPDCTLEELVKYQKEHENTKKEKEWMESIDLEENVYVQSSGLQKETMEDKKNNIKSKYAVLILTVVNLLVVFCLLFEIWTYQYIWVLIVTIFLLLIALIICFHKGGEENPDEIMEEYFKAHNEGYEVFESGKNIRCGECSEKKRSIKDEEGFVQKQDVFWERYQLNMQEEPDELDELEQTVLFVDKKKQIVIEDTPKKLYLKAMEEQKYPDLLIEKKSIIIGSMQKKCDYLLKKKEISRMHAKIMKKEDGIYLLDLNSTNGTILNSHLIESGMEYLIQEGDTIEFGCVAGFEVKER